MGKQFGLAVLAASLACASGPASAYTTIFAFGDSLSDAGNLFNLTGVPGPPYVGGHFSNGPTWVEDLSGLLNLGVLEPSALGGTDFAVGGAKTGDASAIDLHNQVLGFGAYAASLAPATVSGGLFTLDIGANDIISAIADPATANSVIVDAANSAAADVTTLHDDGARSFLFYEVPNLGLTPDFRGTPEQSEVSSLAQLFNTTFIGDLTSLETDPDPLKVSVLDTYDKLTEIVDSPDHDGFSNVTDACIDVPSCVGGSLAEQDTYLFWDGLHPTEGGHMLTAQLAYALVAPEPSTWAMLLAGFAALAVGGWRARRAPVPAQKAQAG